MRRARVVVVLMTGLLITAWSGAAPAGAAPPNDRLHNATTISSVPAVVMQSTAIATADGPRFCSGGNNSSVFFTFTPSTSQELQVDTFGSGYDTVLKVFTGTRGAYDLVGCNDDFVGFQSALSFQAEAGTTYIIMVVTFGSGSRDNVGGHLELGLTARPAIGPTASVTVDDTAAVTAGGKVLLTGTVTCSQRVGVDIFVILRQIRNDLYLARGARDDVFGCDPAAPRSWRMRIDSGTSVIFGPGHITVRGQFFAADTVGSTSALLERQSVTVVA